MKNTTFLKKSSLWILLMYSGSISAQTTVSVVTTQTDKNFANTTEIYKMGAASDTQVLAEIDGNFGLGDVVRITIAPPKPEPKAPTAEVKANVSLNTKNADLAVVETATRPTTKMVVQTKSLPVPNATLEPKTVSTPVVEKQEAAMETNPNLTNETSTKGSIKTKQNQGDISLESKIAQRNNRTAKASNSLKSVKSSKSRSKKTFSLFSFRSFKNNKVRSGGGSKFGCYRF
jgi:hypothetical protein